MSWFRKESRRSVQVDPIEARQIMRLHQRAAQAYQGEDYATSVRLYKELKARVKHFGNEELIAKINRDMGYSYFRLGTPEALERAVELGLAARRTFKQLGLREFIPNVNMNIGNAYEQQENYRKALTHYEKARQSFEPIGRPKGVTLANYNIGRVHLKEDEYKAAITHFEKVQPELERLRMPEARGIKKLMAEAYIGLRDEALETGDREKARTYAEKVRQFEGE